MKSAKKKKGFKFFKQTDLTSGSIWKKILLFSLPIFVSYLLQNLYGMADAAICGHTLSASEVSGVGDTGPITFIFLQFAFGCTAGMSTVIANHTGKKDSEGARKAFATQIVLSILIIAVLTAVSLATIKPLLKLIGIAPSENNVDNAVYQAAHLYLMIICGGMAGQFFYNVICCILRSIGDSVTPLIFLAISTSLNIALDLLFILAFGWGVAGAAAATVLSQSLSAIGCFVYTFIKYKELRPRACDFRAFSFRNAMHTLWQGVPLGLQFSVLAFGLITMQNGVISFDKLPSGGMVEGTPAQIGYGAACRLDNIFFAPFTALGTCMISFTAQNLGAGNRERIKKGTVQCFYIMVILAAVVISIGLGLSVNGTYQRIFLAEDKINSETIRFGNTYLYSALPAVLFLGTLVLMRNVVQGLEKPLFPFLAGIGELAARIVICLVLPRLVNGAPIDSTASTASFFWLGFADAGAWILADIVLLFPIIRYVFLMKPLAKQRAETAEPQNTEAPSAEGTLPTEEVREIAAANTEEPAPQPETEPCEKM